MPKCYGIVYRKGFDFASLVTAGVDGFLQSLTGETMSGYYIGTRTPANLGNLAAVAARRQANIPRFGHRTAVKPLSACRAGGGELAGSPPARHTLSLFKVRHQGHKNRLRASQIWNQHSERTERQIDRRAPVFRPLTELTFNPSTRARKEKAQGRCVSLTGRWSGHSAEYRFTTLRPRTRERRSTLRSASKFIVALLLCL